MFKPGQPDAAASSALLLWVIHHGSAKLYGIVKVYIRHLQQTLLPQLWEYLRQIPSLSLAPAWLAVRRWLTTLVHARVIEFLHKIFAAWLHQYHRLKQCFDNGRSRQAYARQADRKAECSSPPMAQIDDISQGRQATVIVLMSTMGKRTVTCDQSLLCIYPKQDLLSHLLLSARGM